jgi:hypothetical protein
MSKFEINRMTIELIRAILRFRSSFRPLSARKIIFEYYFVSTQHVGGKYVTET